MIKQLKLDLEPYPDVANVFAKVHAHASCCTPRKPRPNPYRKVLDSRKCRVKGVWQRNGREARYVDLNPKLETHLKEMATRRQPDSQWFAMAWSLAACA